MQDIPPFEISGALYPRSPVVIAVAHAGRVYPPEVMASARVEIGALQSLEDRYADVLIGKAAAEGATTIVASLARAAIDLNRDPREIDLGMMGSIRPNRAVLHTQKMRGGLGLIPRRLAHHGELWCRPISEAEVDRRIDEIHIPYHRAISDALAAARAVYGGAILIDCHSMPTLRERAGSRAQIILGDRFGKSASSRLIRTAIDVLNRSKIPHGRNQPYAGGYTLERHGRPMQGIHAVQIEFDRALYVDAAGEPMADGVSQCGRVLADLAMELAACVSGDMPLAAE